MEWVNSILVIPAPSSAPYKGREGYHQTSNTEDSNNVFEIIHLISSRRF